MTMPDETSGPMGPDDIGDAATLLALLSGTRHSTSLRHVLSGWDMLQVDVPSRERVEAAAAVLVGAGLARAGTAWDIRLTAEGARLRRSVPGRTAMRQVPGLLQGRLAALGPPRAELRLSQDLYDTALADYLDTARRRAERRSRSRGPWWWPDPSRR